MNSPLRTLLVGFGGIARGLANDTRMAEWFPVATHAQALAANPDFDWIGVVDPDPSVRALATSDWGIAAFETLSDAVSLDPDVLVLATPPGHRSDALSFFPTLKGLMVEKPLGDQDGRLLIKQCSDRNLPVQVNFWRRGDATLQALAGSELNARIGTLQGGHALYGNGLANNGSHLIDLIRMLLGTPAWVQALGTEQPLIDAPVPGDIQMAFALGFESGACISAHPVDFSQYREVSLDLWGTTGRISMMQETLDIRHFKRAPNRGLDHEFEIASDAGEALASTVASALPNLYENLSAAICDGVALLSPGDSALQTEAIITCIMESSRQRGARIDVKAGTA